MISRMCKHIFISQFFGLLLVGLVLAGCADIEVYGIAEGYKGGRKSTLLIDDEPICLIATV